MAVRLRTLRNGPVIRNTFRLPHPVKTDLRICVIAAPDSKAATEARSAGATLVGEDDIFAQIKAGVMDFDRILCHIDSLPKLNKAAVARVLGPRGLMPSTKTNTVVPTASAIGAAVRNLVGGSEYRERLAVIRMAVGQLGFTPEEMQRNVTAFMDALKKDIDKMKDRINKEIHEVVSRIAVYFRCIVADCAIGPQLDERTRLHAERRLQKRQFDSDEGACWADVDTVYTRSTNSTPPQGVRRAALMTFTRPV
jgi:ribosomal protein L1